MTRIVLGLFIVFVVAGLVACSGGGSEQGAANTRRGGVEPPKKLSYEERVSAPLKVGDKVVIDEDTGHVVCGRDLDALCEFNRFMLTLDVNPQELESTPNDRRLAALLNEGRLVRVKTGTVGEVVAEEGRRPIDRTPIKMPATELVWIKVRFDMGAVFVPKSGLEKK